MKLVEVANLFKEIAEKCPNLNGKNFVIMIADIPEPKTTEGYEITIRTEHEPIDEETLNTLKEIASREKLAIQQKETALLIYKEKPLPDNLKSLQTSKF